jgi:hypothetical protein
MMKSNQIRGNKTVYHCLSVFMIELEERDAAGTAFLCVKSATTQLQGLVKDSRQYDQNSADSNQSQGLSTSSALKALLYLNHATRKALISFNKATGNDCMGLWSADLRQDLALALDAAVKKAFSMCGLVSPNDCGGTAIARGVLEERRQRLQDEIGSLESVIVIPEGRLQKLCRCIAKLTQLEEDLGLHSRRVCWHQISPEIILPDVCVPAVCFRVVTVPLSRLAAEVDRLTGEHDYSDENFAYGSTPASSFVKVCQYMVFSFHRGCWK